MKKLIITVFLLFFAVPVFGAPFLVSDPPAPCGQSGQGACPESADIYEDGLLIASEIALEPDMSLRYDLVTMPTGEHSYTAIYRDDLGRPSELSDPYLLLRLPNRPLGLDATK